MLILFILSLFLFVLDQEDYDALARQSTTIEEVARPLLDEARHWLAGQKGKPQAKAKKVSSAVKVLVQPVRLTANDRVFEAVGTGRARLSLQVYPTVAEEVTKVLFQAQDRVSQGDLLIQLDDREEVLAVRRAEIQLKNARSLLSRYEKAVKEGAVPESEVDTVRADFEAAKVALDQAKLALEDRRIKAPFSGVVGIPKVDPGQRVTTATVITSLDDRKILHVDFEVPEALAGALREAQTENRNITATTPAYPGRTFVATISAQESRVNADRRTVLARASIENEEDLLRPGMSFTTRWTISGKRYPTIPEISLQWGRHGSFVWLARKQKAEKVPVQVIARKAGNVLVEGRLAIREPVVVEGIQRMRPGVSLQIVGEAES